MKKTWVRVRSEDVHTAVLTAEDARTVFLSTEPTNVLAERYGVNRHAISDVRGRKTWKIATEGLTAPEQIKCERKPIRRKYSAEEKKANLLAKLASPEYKAKCREWGRLRTANHPEKNQARNARRRALKKGQLHPLHDKMIESNLYRTANRFAKETGTPHCVDHIIPLSKGGWHHHANMQVMPTSLNSAKRANVFWEHPGYKSWKDVPIELWPEPLAAGYQARLLPVEA